MRSRQEIHDDISRAYQQWFRKRMVDQVTFDIPTTEDYRRFNQRIADLHAELDAPPPDPSWRWQNV